MHQECNHEYTEGGLTYNQTFDAENRLVSVAVNSQTTRFVYDGDGNLVKKVNPDNTKTIYVAGIYEVNKNSGGTVTGTKTYYPAGGAMRVDGTRYYVLKDHLGSASVVTNQSETTVGEDRFYPFGETRFTTGSMKTDKLFTGQREITGLGMYHFSARFYSPRLGRFLSADTIVPDPSNPQDLNRFSYVRNNPIKYIDPTGHIACIDFDRNEGCIRDPEWRPSGSTGNKTSTPVQDDKKPNIYIGVSDDNLIEIYIPVSGSNLINVYLPVSGDNLIDTYVPVKPEDISSVYTSEEPEFPHALQGGESNNYVYIGYDENGEAIYAGITNNIDRRQYEHRDRFDIDPLNDSPLTRGQVRAIEQALIVNNRFDENQRNSISPNHPYYQPAVDWGNWWLDENGQTLFLPNNEA